MKIIKVKNYEEMSAKAAERVLEMVKAKPNVVLGLATGSTPVVLYERMINGHQGNQTTYERVTTFNLDEYVGLGPLHKYSYRFFMEKHLFHGLNIRPLHTHGAGGVDLQILGLGGHGHIGFNEPGSSFESRTQVVRLTQSTRQANARFFHSPEEVPKEAITMGIATILKSKEILLLVSGEGKSKAVRQLLTGKPSETFPASILLNHGNVTMIADEGALSKVLV